MRLLHIIGSLDPAAGGPTEAVRLLVRYQPPGYTSEAVTLDEPGSAFLKDLDFPVHALGGRHAWHSLRLLRWLRAQRHRFDGALVHGLWQPIGPAALWALRHRVPYIVFAHGMLDPYFKRYHRLKHLKKWPYWLLVEFWVLRSAHRVLFTTTLERDLARLSFRLHSWRPLVVPLGTEPPAAPPAALLRAFAAHCPELAGKRFLLFLGRIHPKKGCDLLTQAFAELAAAHPDLHLVIAGPDPAHWRQQLLTPLVTAGVADRVHWPGMLHGGAKWGALAACKAFVLPSHQENFGMAAVEALASGKPVLLAEPVNLAPELARAGCALVEPDTLDGTRRLLARWLALTPTERRDMGERALATFAACYDMRRNAEAILRVFETFSSRRDGR